MGNDILGITPQSIKDYSGYLANKRLKAIGLDEIFDAPKRSPYQHLEKIADTGDGATTKANFFEATVTSYQMATALTGWDF